MEIEDSDETSREEVESESGTVEPTEETTKKKRSLASKQRQRILKAKKLKRKEFFKQPTTDELNALEDYEASVHSSLLRLQIEELLLEIKLKDKRRKDVLNWFSHFKQEVQNFNDSPRYELGDLSWKLDSDVHIPLQHVPLTSKGMFQFRAPEKVELVGSFPLGLALNTELEVDILLTLPKNIFQHDDYKNHRYHWKRAMYITYLVSLLRRSNLVEEINFEYLHSDTLKPIVVLKPKGKLGKRAVVKILVCPPADYFQFNRLTSAICNIKSTLYVSTPLTPEPDGPTPLYNNSVLVDTLTLHSHEYVAGVLGMSQGVCDGILLLKVWLRQRYLNRGHGAMNNFIITMFVGYLLQTKKLHPSMSSYQVVRNVWLSLSQSDWTVRPISCYQHPKQSEVLRDMMSAFPVVFVDSTGFMNVCASMEASTFLQVKHEATLAMKLIETGYNFDALFMTSLPFVRKFDHIVRIKNLDWKALVSKFGLSNKLRDCGGSVKSLVTSSLSTILHKGLGKRVSLLAVELEVLPKWAVTDIPPSMEQGELKFGLLLDPEQSISVLDKGPAADLPEAATFRDFWGSKSELRRFQDGSICEAVVWQGNCLAEKRLVCAQVIHYVLKKHAGIEECDIAYIGGQLDALLNFPFLSWPAEWSPCGTGEEAFLLLFRSFDSLVTQLRSLQGLPLTVTSVQGIAPSFRYTEVFPPLPTKIHYEDKVVEVDDNRFVPNAFSRVCPKWIPHLDVLLFMEGSGKWPDEAEAVLHIKAAFHLNLAEQLQEQCGLITIVHNNHIDVFKDGYVYSLKVTYKREVSLLKMEYTSDGILRLRDNDVASLLECQTVQLPKLTSTLHGLQLNQSTFSAACRLAKRWISCQLLSDHVPDIAIELIVAHLYVSPGPFTQPRSPQVAFQRFLTLLSKHDWKTTPLIVDLNSELSKEDMKEIQSKFSATRQTLPMMFIATPYDRFCSVWTKTAPNATIVHRLSQLASAALATLEAELLEDNVDEKHIFRPSLTPYDVIIRLRPLQIPLRSFAVDIDPKTQLLDISPYAKEKGEKFPVVGYNPVQCYVRELKEAYDKFAAFFFDAIGGEFIAVLWKPEAFQTHLLPVSHVNCHMVHDSVLQKTTTVEAILEDFKIIGQGLVKSIEAKPDKWLID